MNATMHHHYKISVLPRLFCYSAVPYPQASNGDVVSKCMSLKGYYHMAGNFRGVLIFIIFVVDLAVTKFSHPRKLMPTVESTMMGVAKNIVAAWPTLPSVNKQQ